MRTPSRLAAALTAALLALVSLTAIVKIQGQTRPSAANENTIYDSNEPGRILLPSGDIYSTYIQAYNVDGTNNFQLSHYRYGTQIRYPSVAQQTGVIAFQGCGELLPTGTGCEHGTRIFTMNADGSNFRQVTSDAGLSDPLNQQDKRPVISPDGAKIAFISNRPTASYNRAEAFVVNADGTNLHQITAHQNIPNVGESQAYSVVWSADSQKVLVHATRVGKDSRGNDALISSLYTYNADGTGETLLQQGVFDGPIAVDWSPDGKTILYANVGGPYNGTYGYTFFDAANPTQSTFLSGMQLHALGDAGNGFTLIGLGAGSVRFSPDSQKIVYADSQDNSVRTVKIDGTNMSAVVSNYYFYNQEKWWQPGAAIPKPDHLTLTPNPVAAFTDQPAQVTPTLYDAQGNVIFHSAQLTNSDTTGFICNQQHPCSGNVGTYGSVTVNGLVYINYSNHAGVQDLCGANAGLSACTTVAFNVEAIGVTTATPVIRKSGADGAGAFTLKRRNQAGATFPSVAVSFTTSGKAVRDTDYYLTDSSGTRINGNVLNIPAGQTSFDIKVVPILSASAGDKDVTLTVQSDNTNSAYFADGAAASATITIKDDGSNQSALALTSLTPSKGGDTGSVTMTVFGANIKAGATVKLTRNGQADINGTSASVAANNSSITATFDLTGKAQGAWSIVVTNPDNSTATLPNAFTVEAGLGYEVWADVVGRFTMRTGYDQQFFIAVGNTGDSDAPATKLIVTLPADLFFVTQRPEYPTGAPAFFSNDGETITMELYMSKVAAGSATYIPFRLNPRTDHVDFEIGVTALTSPDLQPIVDRPIDPNSSVSITFSEQTPTSQKAVMHITTSQGQNDVQFVITEKDASAPKEPSTTLTETNGVLHIVEDMTVPSADIGDLSKAATAKALGSPRFRPKDGSTLKEIVSDKTANGHQNADGSVNFDSLDQDARFKDANIQNTQDTSDMRLAAVKALKDNGLISDADSHQLYEDITASLDTLYDRLTNAHTRLSDYTQSQWSNDLYKIYQAHPDKFNSFLGLDGYPYYLNTPLNGNPFHATTSKIFLEFLDKRMYKATRYHRDNTGRTSQSGDPNDKSGPQGAGGDQHYITGAQPSGYAISFENKPDATAPAQDVVITDQLDASKFDLSTFQLGAVNFGTNIAAPPAGLSSWTTDVDLRPSNNVIVRVNAALDINTGIIRWTFTSLDPATLQHITDPLGGFLPPNVTSPEGQGGVLFTVQPKAGLTTGTIISNKATIVFDHNAPIDTNTFSNTIDNSKPTSSVSALPATSCNNFVVNWSGTDSGSGIQSYTVFVSDNGGAFTAWQLNTTQTSATFNGQSGHSYAFYSVARDNANNIENAPSSAEATTNVAADTTAPTVSAVPSSAPNAAGWYNQNVNVSLNATDGGACSSGVSQIVYSASGAQMIASTTVNGSSAFVSITNEGVTTLAYQAKDNAGNVSAPQTLVVKLDKTPPVVTCAAPNANWSATDVSVQCTATDGNSSLANAADAKFTLSTNVAAGTETSGAQTNSRKVCDVAGNCSAAGPVGGIRVDKKAPSINIIAPANATYNLGQLVVANYSCADGGAGLQSCTATLDNRLPLNNLSLLDTLLLGTHTLTVTATDKVGNKTTQSVSYTVALRVGNNTPTADLSLTMDAPSQVSAGQNIAYTIKVKNAGPSAVPNVYLYNLEIPQGATFVSATTTQGSLNAPAAGSATGLITGNLGTLNKGDTVTIMVVMKVASPTSLREILAGAAVTANVFDPQPLNNIAAVSTRIK